ncbi:uncharacterized protein PAC_12358 [Phialocephala subalpina]|uniref:Cyclopropane-fatty-acyl-phospholipid synthase n=1 Tax=Phialocephala subalpina TaxID=576137 RepID=A0A1L7XBR5_9HELO|nr:uncharacterized protein PAC_12358 [Phialocephala subalpina]
MITSDAQIKQSDRVLEIGTGWGSFAIEAVRQTGCTVTNVTLSVEQEEEAERRINSAGFSENIKVLLLDYREISAEENQFDRVVSIEMMEHVGRENFTTYFKGISKLLHKKRGIAVLQTSTMPDSVCNSPRTSEDLSRLKAGFKTKTLGVVMFTVGRERNTEMLRDCMKVPEWE